MLITFLVELIIVLIIISALYLVMYIFSKYVTPIDNKIVGILIFIIFAILLLYLLTGHTLIGWHA